VGKREGDNIIGVAHRNGSPVPLADLGQVIDSVEDNRNFIWFNNKRAIGLGAGGETRRPLGLAVVGGLVFSQIVTPYTTQVTLSLSR
jgi:multidrug efflux pump subunit AcrB